MAHHVSLVAAAIPARVPRQAADQDFLDTRKTFKDWEEQAQEAPRLILPGNPQLTHDVVFVVFQTLGEGLGTVLP